MPTITRDPSTISPSVADLWPCGSTRTTLASRTAGPVGGFNESKVNVTRAMLEKKRNP